MILILCTVLLTWSKSSLREIGIFTNQANTRVCSVSFFYNSCTTNTVYFTAQTTCLTHAKLVSLTSPCCSGWPAPLNTSQGQQRELSSNGCVDFNAWLESDLELITNFNSTHKQHMNPHTWQMFYDTCYFLIFATDINSIPPIRQSILRDARAALPLPAVITRLRSED